MEIAIGTDFKPLDFMETHVVIMAGGIGSRLWPVSTPERPKQFMDLLGIGKTMIQLTFNRFTPVCDPANFWVVTSEDYVRIVREQLPLVPQSHILAEPEPRKNRTNRFPWSDGCIRLEVITPPIRQGME